MKEAWQQEMHRQLMKMELHYPVLKMELDPGAIATLFSSTGSSMEWWHNIQPSKDIFAKVD